jgi:GWxTD domain-containing protein
MMKNPIVFTLFLVLFGHAFASVQEREMVYYVDVCTFYDQSSNPYIELYLDVDAYTIDYFQTEGGAFQGSVDVELSIVEKSTPDPVFAKRFELMSPETRDTARTGKPFGIMDVRRITLQPGSYVITGLLRDKNRPDAKQHKFVQEILIDAQSQNFASTSEIEFIQSFNKTTTVQPHSKLGYDILPLVTNSTFVDMDSLKFYMEVYHIDKESEKGYYLNAYITQSNSTEKMIASQVSMRKSVQPLDIVTAGLDISGLPSQTYYLNVDIYNHQNKLISTTTKKFFVVSSSVEAQDLAQITGLYDEYFNLDEEKLDYYIHTLYYVSTSTERQFAKSLTTFQEKKNYFLNYWTKRRNANADSPAKPWHAYKSRVDYANQHFKSSHLEGWRTERGRIMITHGPPNDIERFPSSNSNYPYLIWRYNKIKTQANRMFVFYDPNMATGEYVLLHSDLNGEPSNPRWEFDVKRMAMDANLDVNDSNGKWR